MTNYEKFKDLLDKFGVCNIKWGVKNGEPVECDAKIACRDCEFAGSCTKKRLEWLDSEYKEPYVDWSNVPVDTKILVSHDGKDWLKRHFAGIDPTNKKPRAWICGRTSFTESNFKSSSKFTTSCITNFKIEYTA